MEGSGADSWVFDDRIADKLKQGGDVSVRWIEFEKLFRACMNTTLARHCVFGATPVEAIKNLNEYLGGL